MTAHRETARREPDRWTHMTLEDVAKAARVSPATASRVLNGSATVHAELAARV
ncbi:LacI family DNA-binding transcriptional regulator, partial [Amycolatopsis mediterranei]